MVIEPQNLNELDDMKRDFQKIGCRLRIRGGMKKRGYTEHDLDLNVLLSKRKNLLASFSKMKKWNRIFQEEYGIILDVLIRDAKGKHIFDFDGRYPTFLARPWESVGFEPDGAVTKRDTRNDNTH